MLREIAFDNNNLKNLISLLISMERKKIRAMVQIDSKSRSLAHTLNFMMGLNTFINRFKQNQSVPWSDKYCCKIGFFRVRLNSINNVKHLFQHHVVQNTHEIIL